MPCCDGGQAETDARAKSYEQDQLDKLTKMVIPQLEAMLCAIVDELDSRRILKSVIRGAERNGKVNIFPWIEKHAKCDNERLMKILVDQFSPQELNKIKLILNESKQG